MSINPELCLIRIINLVLNMSSVCNLRHCVRLRFPRQQIKIILVEHYIMCYYIIDSDYVGLLE